MTPTEKPKKVVQKTSQRQRLTQLQQKFLEYFREVPIQKYAAAHVGRKEEAIIDWKSKNPNFANQIEDAKAEFVKSKLGGVKSNEWILERLFKDHFAEKKEVDVGVNAEIQKALDRLAQILPPAK
jgi:hypothetical protein